MIDVHKQFDGVPANYPAAPSGLSDNAAALDADMIWARIEGYVAHRYTEREVVWTLIGDAGNQWHPPLAPIVSRHGHVWENDVWRVVTLITGPLGIILPHDGTYRVTAQVGGGDVPAAFSEAFRRLAEYMADDPGRAGAYKQTDKIGPLDEELTRSPAWLARAMQLSGAADLLRPYRRA